MTFLYYKYTRFVQLYICNVFGVICAVDRVEFDCGPVH